MSFFKPERYFERITDIDIACDIVACGFVCALIDVDNTIRSREDGAIPRDVREWLHEVDAAGVQACLFSNNWHADIYDLGRELGLPVIAKAMKPLPHAYALARTHARCPRSLTLAIGDQLLTDVCGAHLVGMAAYLVEPLAQKDLRHTRMLRHLERALLGSMRPE